MLKVLVLSVMAFGFVACEDELAKLVKGDAVLLPTGFYKTQCLISVDGMTSTKEDLEIENQTTIVQTVENYSDPACTTLTSEEAPVSITIATADFSFANEISYFQIGGENEFQAYYIEEGLVYFSDSKSDVNEDNIASSFSEFVKSPKDNAALILTPYTPAS